MEEIKNKCINIFEILDKNYKDRDLELQYVNEFTLLVAIVLSAQATDKIVNKATEQMFQKYQNPQDFANLQPESLHEYIKIINLYKTKAKNIIALSKIILEEFNATVPDNFDALIKLPGVGRKTANVFLANAKGHNVIGVDTHVLRVSNRLGLASSKNPKKVEEALCKVIPESLIKKTNHYLVLHGRYICKAQKPLCGECKINAFCNFKKPD